jgi:O-antigen biosynthesis protein
MTIDKDWQKDYPSTEKVAEDSLEDNSSLKKMLNLVGDSKEVVDFGCATGYFSNLLQKKGCVVTGVEINIDAAKVAEKYCKKVVVADLDFVSVTDILPSQMFDVAVFGDILEHLRNPWKILSETRKILKKDGYVIASIPNIAHAAIRLSLLQGRFDYTDFGILDNTHIRFFTRKTVKELFDKSGYLSDIVDCTKLDSFSESHLIPQNTRSEFNLETIAKIEEDKDYDTLQFIVRSYPCSQSQIQQFQTELERSEAPLHPQTQSEFYRSQVQSHPQTQAELDRLQSQIQQLQAELAQSKSQFYQLQSELAESQSQLQSCKYKIMVMENNKL